jgi:hypothetical protein
LVKGISRRVVVVDSPDPDLFEQAIFIIRNDSAEGVSSQQLVDHAVRIAKNYSRTHAAPRRRFRPTPLAAALAGAAVIALLWLVMELI